MNPLIWRKGICDPHIHIFEGKAYMYATHDAPGYEDNFHMEDWEIWSSENLVDWKQEAVIRPEEFYCGPLDQCWAVDAAYKNGKYYFYFSTGDWGVGVAVGDTPAGPFYDVLGKALVDYDTHPRMIQKWDPCVFVDDDGEAYLIVGTCRQGGPWNDYLIARLNPDMISLAEPLRLIGYEGNPWPEDKASVHKFGGRYYLTHSSYYAVADNVYGPYQYVGNTGCNIDHGSFFTYHNQTYFASGGMDNTNRFLRASFLAPCHYKKNGEIVIDQKIMEYGCGQYDAAWEKIEARWYFDASEYCQMESEDGNVCVQLEKGGYISFPNVSNIEEDARIKISGQALDGGVSIEIHEDTPDGRLLAACRLEDEKEVFCQMKCSSGKKNLVVTVDGAVILESFTFIKEKKISVMEPVFSAVGRGACIACDLNASMNRTLQHMELRWASMEAWADGGAGGEGILGIFYACAEKQTKMKVFVNGEMQGTVEFPVTGSIYIDPTPARAEIKVKVKPGLNKIRIGWDEDYQSGKLTVDHMILETEKSCWGVYTAANGELDPKGNGCWDGFAQRECDPLALSGRVVKYLEKPGDSVTVDHVDGGNGGEAILEVRYSRGEAGASAYRVVVNGKQSEKLMFEETGSFSLRNTAVKQTKIVLEPGKKNSISLLKEEKADKGIFVDAFSVLPG